jgi:hypothetical protein
MNISEKLNQQKGKCGELVVKSLIKYKFKGSGYYLLNDIIVNNKDTHESQIDHLLVTPKAVFIIETKYKSGIIEQDKKTKKIKAMYNGKEYEDEALEQNQKHKDNLILNLFKNYSSQICFYNMVVYVVDEEEQLKLIPNVENHQIFNQYNFLDKIEETINSDYNKTRRIFPEDIHDILSSVIYNYSICKSCNDGLVIYEKKYKDKKTKIKNKIYYKCDKCKPSSDDKIYTYKEDFDKYKI